LPYETFGAIDRIDQPQVLGIFLCPTGFLTIESMLGKLLENYAANRLFAFDVRLGDGRQVLLGRDRKIPGIVRTTNLRCLLGSGQRNFQIRGRRIIVKLFHGPNYGRKGTGKQAPFLDSDPAAT
jgi:hypothetical protein